MKRQGENSKIKGEKCPYVEICASISMFGGTVDGGKRKGPGQGGGRRLPRWEKQEVLRGRNGVEKEKKNLRGGNGGNRSRGKLF